MMKVILPAAAALCLLGASVAFADEASAPSSLQVIGPDVSRVLTTQTTEQVSTAVAEANRPQFAEPGGETSSDGNQDRK